MFNPDFYPTPEEIIQLMVHYVDFFESHILEPSAGKGDIVDYIKKCGPESIDAFEKDPELAKLVSEKCNLIDNDFLQATAQQISHIDYIIMNPPFSAGDKHIRHAFEIAPDGCTIIALCNSNTIDNSYTYGRRRLEQIIHDHGVYENLGDVFSNSERKTKVEVSLVKIFKPAAAKSGFDYSGFFTEADDPEEQAEGLMPYNEVRDIVSRYVNSLKVFDEMREVADKMNAFIEPIGLEDGFEYKVGYDGKSSTRAGFEKLLQKRSWQWIIKKLDIDRYVTSGVMKKINKFVENQKQYPFTMKNIYQMMDMIVQTRGQTMQEALVDVFDKLTRHHHKNQYKLDGWKTNSHYLVNKKFILDWCTELDFGGSGYMSFKYNGNASKMEDLHKALSYITGKRPEVENLIYGRFQDGKAEFGTWYDWGFLKIKGFKKGTLHAKFKDEKVWELFNRKVAEAKGFELPKSL